MRRNSRRNASQEFLSGIAMTCVFGTMYLVTDAGIWMFAGLLFGVMPTLQGAGSLLERRRIRKAEKALHDPKRQRVEHEKQILRSAAAEAGRITAPIAALHSSCSVEDCESILQDLVSRGHALMEVRDDGRVEFLFPEFFRRGD